MKYELIFPIISYCARLLICVRMLEIGELLAYFLFADVFIDLRWPLPVLST